MRLSDAAKAGVALFVGVVQFGIFEIISEAVYPGYSVGNNYISDLGPPCAGGASCGSQTSWWIFDSSIVIMGLCVLLAAYFIQRYFRWKPITGLVALAGAGAVGVGIFNETAPFGLHDIFTLLTFLTIGLTAIVSYRLQKRPLSYFGVIMGALTLLALLLYLPDTGAYWGGIFGIGVGGLERMIVYPVLFWSIAFSGQLMAME